MNFIKGFEKKAAGIKGFKPSTLDKAGLVALMAAPAYHTYKSVKEKDHLGTALGASELGGLGLLYRAAQKAHP